MPLLDVNLCHWAALSCLAMWTLVLGTFEQQEIILEVKAVDVILSTSPIETPECPLVKKKCGATTIHTVRLVVWKNACHLFNCELFPFHFPEAHMPRTVSAWLYHWLAIKKLPSFDFCLRISFLDGHLHIYHFRAGLATLPRGQVDTSSASLTQRGLKFAAGFVHFC